MQPFFKRRYLTATEMVSEQIREAIMNGDLAPGAQLPPETELVEMFGVSRGTLRESLRMLEEQGLIIRRHGKGTFVRARPILKNLSVNYGITDMIASAGYTPGTAYLDLREEAADPETAKNLEIQPGSEVIVVERTRTADGQPVVFSVDIFPKSLLRVSLENLQCLRERSIYEYFQTEWGLSIHHGVARLAPVAADKALARRLSIREGAPLLYILQVDYLSDERPVLLSHEYHVPGAFEITVYRSGPGGAVQGPRGTSSA
ncbi:MAG: GntR family transcriptional regulator [Anaerolineae bacterium]